MEELQNDVLRYNARLDDNNLLNAIKPHMRMEFDDGRISWHLIEKYEDVWRVSGMEFTSVTFDLSLNKLLSWEGDNKEFKDVVFYVMSRVRGRRPS
jgi:hypothetical protein